MVSPFLFFSGERLSLAELTAACLDGALVPLGEGYMPADAVETPWMRAKSLSPLLGHRWAAVRSSAAWVHGATPLEPRRHHAQRVSAARSHVPRTRRAQYHEVRLSVSDTVALAGVHVSTQTRTFVDLLRCGDSDELEVARRWGAQALWLVDDAARWLDDHPRFPYARRAVEALREMRAPDGC